ncbi:MAG: Fe-S cluster assembly protein SufD [Candidatus Melainabacteria bacterium]|nr:Fe-S cluster assembly protein SufD [Candidatus Melainabacteria bacterium]
MTGTKSASTTVRQTVADFAVCPAEPPWLKKVRFSAWETFQNTPMPTSREDSWRRTEINSLDFSDLTILTFAEQSKTTPQLPTWFSKAIKGLDKPAGIFLETNLNAGYLELSSDLSNAGVIFEPNRAAVESHGDLIRPYLCAELNNHAHLKFSSMNKALFNSGVFLYVPPGVQIDAPFITGINIEDSSDITSCTGIFPHLIVVADSHSKVNLWHMASSNTRTRAPVNSGNNADNSAVLLVFNQSVYVHVGPSAEVNYLEIQQLGSNAFSVGLNHNEVYRDGLLTSLVVSVGGKQAKTDIVTALQEPGAKSKVLGIVIGNDKESFNFNTIQEHNAPDTKSDINFRVALNGSATSVYQGIIRVAKQAQKTDAYQSNKNLLLGSQARADSIPKLEILADDVKCSHGATVGPVDKDQVFYLMSRGMTLKQAEELIVQGFFRKVIEEFDMSLMSSVSEPTEDLSRITRLLNEIIKNTVAH